MPALQPLCSLFRVNLNKLSREEKFILEAELLNHICNELKMLFRNQYNDYFRLMKFTKEMVATMLDTNYICFVIKDILLTEEYTLTGIACYTQTPEEVVYELVSGCNTRPSAIFLQRIIELHRSVRSELYNSILKKNCSTLFGNYINHEKTNLIK